MPSYDERTPRGWPLPFKENALEFDVERIRETFCAIDEALGKIEQRQYALDARVDSITGISNESCVIFREITLPVNEWSAKTDELVDDEYKVQLDIEIDKADETMFPHFALALSSLSVSEEAVLCPVVKSCNGYVRFWAKKRPSEGLKGTIVLLLDKGEISSGFPAATDSTLGGVKVKKGSGLTIDEEGNIFINTATTEEIEELYSRY